MCLYVTWKYFLKRGLFFFFTLNTYTRTHTDMDMTCNSQTYGEMYIHTWPACIALHCSTSDYVCVALDRIALHYNSCFEVTFHYFKLHYIHYFKWGSFTSFWQNFGVPHASEWSHAPSCASPAMIRFQFKGHWFASWKCPAPSVSSPIKAHYMHVWMNVCIHRCVSVVLSNQ